MTLTESVLDLNTLTEGMYMLIVADAQLLVRPAVPGQYPSSVKHDSAHAYWVLSLQFPKLRTRSWF